MPTTLARESGPAGGSIFRVDPNGVRVRVRLTPRGGATRIDGIRREGDGEALLGARVAPPPADGKANAALTRLLAETWKLPKSSITVTAGTSDRRKTILVAGDPAALMARLTAWETTLNEET